MKYTLILLMGSWGLSGYGQQSINTTGGNVQGNDGSVSFSIGQVATNYVESNHRLNEGVQQPYEFFQVVSIDKISKVQFFTISPNPTSGIIQLNSSEVRDAEIEIFDDAGRLVWKQAYQNILSETIDLHSYARGVYSIRVMSDSSLQLIKIVKN